MKLVKDRKFNGIVYRAGMKYRKKSQALKNAKFNRFVGFGSRVVKIKNGYRVYTTARQLSSKKKK